MTSFPGKVGLIQRVLPHYRSPFFNALGKACEGGLSIFTGQPKAGEMIKPVEDLEHAQVTKGNNIHLFKGALYLCLQLGLMNWLKNLDPDILIMEANPRYLRTPSACRWMHQQGQPVIGWGLGAPPISGPLAKLRQKRRQKFVNQFDVMITYSQTGASEYARLGFTEDRIFVAPNAVSPHPKHGMPERLDPQKIQKLRILFVGRLQERKKLDNLILACSQLPADLQPELVIVGDGPDKIRLRKLAGQSYPKTTFTGALYGGDLAEQFQKADLFVLPGTGGLAIQQAMSYGLPVIAAQADGTQADLVRVENGWQVPPDDLPALQKTLESALSDRSVLREMGTESFRIVSEEINLEQMVQGFIRAINRSLS